MTQSLIERAELHSKGAKSKYFDRIKDLSRGYKLEDETISIMALICDRADHKLCDAEIQRYHSLVIMAQALMPSGYLTSRQCLATLAVMGGMRT